MIEFSIHIFTHEHRCLHVLYQSAYTHTRKACTHIQTHTYTHTSSHTLGAGRTNLFVFVKHQGRKSQKSICLSSLSFITLVHSHIHTDSFSFSVACHKVRAGSLFNATHKKSQEEIEKRDTGDDNENKCSSGK